MTETLTLWVNIVGMVVVPLALAFVASAIRSKDKKHDKREAAWQAITEQMATDHTHIIRTLDKMVTIQEVLVYGRRSDDG